MRSFCSNHRWEIETKAFEKSNKIRIVTLDSSIVNVMSPVTATCAVLVKWHGGRKIAVDLVNCFVLKTLTAGQRPLFQGFSGSMAMVLVSEMVSLVVVFNNGLMRASFQYVGKIDVAKEQLHMAVRKGDTMERLILTSAKLHHGPCFWH